MENIVLLSFPPVSLCLLILGFFALPVFEIVIGQYIGLFRLSANELLALLKDSFLAHFVLMAISNCLVRPSVQRPLCLLFFSLVGSEHVRTGTVKLTARCCGQDC